MDDNASYYLRQSLRQNVPHKQFYTPIYILTGIFGVGFFIGPCFAKGPHKEIIKPCIRLACFSMWLLWVTVYIAQMNPLVGPRLTNDTLIWVAHVWGNPL